MQTGFSWVGFVFVPNPCRWLVVDAENNFNLCNRFSAASDQRFHVEVWGDLTHSIENPFSSASTRHRNHWPLSQTPNPQQHQRFFLIFFKIEHLDAGFVHDAHPCFIFYHQNRPCFIITFVDCSSSSIILYLVLRAVGTLTEKHNNSKTRKVSATVE